MGPFFKRLIAISLVLLIAAILVAFALHTHKDANILLDCLLCKLGFFYSLLLLSLFISGYFSWQLLCRLDIIDCLHYCRIFSRTLPGRSPPLTVV